jgi:hypothetical protein
VYARISATKGFITPLYIHDVGLDVATGKWQYTFRVDKRPTLPSRSIKLVPGKLYEEQILRICEALDIQISVLQREFNAAVELFQKTCNSTDASSRRPTMKVYEDFKNTVEPPDPRFGYNEVVYLAETAQTVGRLEAYRVTDLNWDNGFKEWLYSFQLKPRPEFHMTIGDADNWRRAPKILLHESDLCTYCEAQEFAVDFLTEALNRAIRRRISLCADVTGSTGSTG